MDLFCKQNVIHGDCLEVMRGTQKNSIDCILTDPPYGLKFMGQHWDKGVPSKEFWVEALRVCKPGSIMLVFGATRTYHRLSCAIEDAGWEIKDCLMWLYGSGFPKGKSCLKPAWEPIILCRKKGIIQNLNIDECRITTHEIITNHSRSSISSVSKGIYGDSASQETHQTVGQKLGRWPSNLLLDEEAAALLDHQSGIIKSGKNGWNQTKKDSGMWRDKKRINHLVHNDSGGASRFFYCAKASPSERGEFNKHPTVKPTKLLEYLLKLIIPPHQDAIVLDPFCGSGSTLVAAKNLGFNAVGIEIEEEYCNIARRRLE